MGCTPDAGRRKRDGGTGRQKIACRNRIFKVSRERMLSLNVVPDGALLYFPGKSPGFLPPAKEVGRDG
jgi:hypothetical protein